MLRVRIIRVSWRFSFEALAKTGKFFIHTSGLGVANDKSGRRICCKDPESRKTQITRWFHSGNHGSRRNRYVREAGIDQGIRTVVICPAMIYGRGRGLNTESDQIPKPIAF